jgi:hypothetical protein
MPRSRDLGANRAGAMGGVPNQPLRAPSRGLSVDELRGLRTVLL